MKKQMVIMGLLSVLLLTSCASRKSFVYLQDMKPGEEYPKLLREEIGRAHV